MDKEIKTGDVDRHKPSKYHWKGCVCFLRYNSFFYLIKKKKRKTGNN